MKKVGRFMLKAIINIVQYFARRFMYNSRLESKVDMMMRRLIRLEIINAIDRKDTKTVYELYDEYKAVGGNSYITHMVENYTKKLNKRKKK